MTPPNRAIAPVDRVSRNLLSALDDRVQIAPMSKQNPQFDIDAAYRVTAEIRRLREARGERVLGRKIGFTNRAIWPEYGVSEIEQSDQRIGFSAAKRPTAEHARFHQFHQLSIGGVELLVSGRQTLPQRLLSKLPVHGEALLQDDTPFVGEVIDGKHDEPDSLDQIAVAIAALETLRSDSSPHDVGLL